ncbi:low temperature-induced protein [Paenibacillaceae bacterium]|nr:low temperature-induced protein [Paenibacillaceae bacterium]
MDSGSIRKVAAIFASEEAAVQAIEALKAHGYESDEISIVARDQADVDYVSGATGTRAEEGMTAGVAAGGMLGGLTGLIASAGALAIPGIGPIIAAGPIVAAVTGALAGAGAGGLIGGLVGLGIAEDQASVYQEQVKAGHILVLVDAEDGRHEQIYDIFRAHNAITKK